MFQTFTGLILCALITYLSIISGALANLEKALLEYVYATVLSKGFRPVVVPDLVSRAVTRACGVIQRENQHSIQVREEKGEIVRSTVSDCHHCSFQYFLNEEPDVALSGTAEMGISAFLQGRTFKWVFV